MATTQAQRLGDLLAKARRTKGLSVRGLAEVVGISSTWVSNVEQGRFPNPAPDRLARLAEALDVPASRIDRITKGAMSSGLPEMRTYFRTKYAMNAEQIAQVEAYVKKLQGSDRQAS